MLNHAGCSHTNRKRTPITPISPLIFAFLVGFLVAVSSPAASAEEGMTCLDCHGDATITPNTEGRKAEGLHVKEDALKGSVHESLSCSDCHSDDLGAVTPHYMGGEKPKLQCGECHSDAEEQYLSTDIHGQRYKKNDPDAPWCSDCHGGHQILPLKSRDSLMSRQHQPELCGKCHGNDSMLPQAHSGISKRRLIDRYYESAHWAGIQAGKESATCTDCHGHHSILPTSDPKSHVARSTSLVKTCKKCHMREANTYLAGSHGRTLRHGNLDVPTCITCHGDHDIIALSIKADGKRDYAATQVCIWCHGNLRMMSRYALDTSPVEHYMRDYHGLSQRGSSGASATCADCHDAHHSLPDSHPESRMNISNRGTTCGKCHGKSSDSFILSFSHKLARGKAELNTNVVWYITVFYILLIVLVVGGMFIHNFLIWLHYVRRKAHYQVKKAKLVRLNVWERIWHWILLLCFMGLALTGFMLTFSEFPVFRWVYTLGFTEQTRATIHHFLGVVMVLDLLAILIYGLFSRWGRRWWTEMFPRVQDIRDFIQTMKYHLFLSRRKPIYPVFSYAEKAEWWALLWGTMVMALTGLVMWFPSLMPANSPSWLFAALKTIHYYEAILACLSIVVWHFYHTIFHPEEAPMNTAWLTGVLSEHEAEHRFTEQAQHRQIIEEKETIEIEPPKPAPWTAPTEGTLVNEPIEKNENKNGDKSQNDK
jgi:formate dehydrogenase gamma subunit